MPKPTEHDAQTSLPVLKTLARLFGRTAARELTAPFSAILPVPERSDSGLDSKAKKTDERRKNR